MPVQPCQSGGRQGFKWGRTGKCFTHDGSSSSKTRARERAATQGRAIKARQAGGSRS